MRQFAKINSWTRSNMMKLKINIIFFKSCGSRVGKTLALYWGGPGFDLHRGLTSSLIPFYLSSLTRAIKEVVWNYREFALNPAIGYTKEATPLWPYSLYVWRIVVNPFATIVNLSHTSAWLLTSGSQQCSV